MSREQRKDPATSAAQECESPPIPVLYEKLPAARAHDLVENDLNNLPGALSGVGVLFLLVGSIALAVVLWRGVALPRWAPRWAIGCLVVAIAMLAASDISWWFPHGPVLLYVGLAGYGIGLACTAGSTGSDATSGRERVSHEA